MTVMASLWHKLINTSPKKKQALRSIFAGFVSFLGLKIVFWMFPGVRCPFLWIFQIPCPGCGLMRGFTEILTLDFVAAIEYNLLSVPLFAGCVFYGLFAVFDILFDWSILDTCSRFCRKPIIVFLCITLSFLLYFLNRKF